MYNVKFYLDSNDGRKLLVFHAEVRSKEDYCVRSVDRIGIHPQYLTLFSQVMKEELVINNIDSVMHYSPQLLEGDIGTWLMSCARFIKKHLKLIVEVHKEVDGKLYSVSKDGEPCAPMSEEIQKLHKSTDNEYDIPKPKYKINQKVWYMCKKTNTPRESAIDQITIKVSTQLPQTILYCVGLYAGGNIYEPNLYATKQELLESL